MLAADSCCLPAPAVGQAQLGLSEALPPLPHLSSFRSPPSSWFQFCISFSPRGRPCCVAIWSPAPRAVSVPLALESPGCASRTPWARRELCCHPQGRAPVLSAAPFPHVSPSVRSGPWTAVAPAFPETRFGVTIVRLGPARSHNCGWGGSGFQACATGATPPCTPSHLDHLVAVTGTAFQGRK